ncbi:MAG: tetratricopeptide repeat protein [Steroidobacteraceae bacterium]
MRPRSKFQKGRLVAVTIIFLACTSPDVSGQPCAACHPKEVQGFLATPMAQSMGPPSRGASGNFYHDVSNTRFTIESSPGQTTQRMERDGLTSQNIIAYSVGSGTHAVAYLVQVGNHLFQSPLSYYATSGWGMSPGYEKLKYPDFDRAVRPPCLFCHSGEVRPIAETLNAYENPPFTEAISCERCHGSASAHLRNPAPGSIINPAKLEPRARDSVCEQCHLDGEVSIPNPGKETTDFRAGERLEDVYTVYVYQSSRDPAKPNPLTIISQSQQLALSKCALNSADKLWCGTCHNPHALPKEPVAYYRDRCLKCHGAALRNSHPKPNQDCVGCHMPRLPVGRGAHTIFTDHRIAIYTPQELARLRSASMGNGSAPATDKDELVPWRNPPPKFAQRNLGLAYALAGRRLNASAFVRHGYELLLSASNDFPNDPALLRAMGNAMTGSGAEASAQSLFSKVLSIKPNSAMVYYDMAFAAAQAGNTESAIEYLEKTLQVDPFLVTAYKELARLYTTSGQSALARETYGRFLKAFPESIEAKKDVLRGADSPPRP